MIHVYGQVVPGDYLVDQYGNGININAPMRRGNTYRDAQSAPGGAWDGGSSVQVRQDRSIAQQAASAR